nr:hypothetical protein TetV2_00437 [Oceanusvirus sp.]
MYRIAVYEDRNRKDANISVATSALRQYVKKHADCVFVPYDAFRLVDCEYAVVWGSDTMKRKKKDKSPRRLEVYAHQKRKGGVVVCVEMGFLDRTRNFSVSLWDIVGYGDYSMNLPPPPVPRRSFVPEITDLHHDPEGHTLFCQQKPKDAQIRGVHYMTWMKETVEALLSEGERVVFRRHPKLTPREHGSTTALLETIKGNGNMVESENRLLDDDLMGCAKVVAYNSNSLLEACLRRVPIVCLGPGSVVASLASASLESPARRPTDAELNRVLNCVTWYQWSVEDIRKGLPFRFTARDQNS